MNEDIITIYDDNSQKDYKVLFVIEKEYKYIVYTDIDNNDLNKELYAIKVKDLINDESPIPITEDEWTMIETEYKKLINE